ncbi:Homeobox protein YOX1 [Smittium mucronatum]|uniref:Homeobox protein YOX1 n=1 Tax=Smittium mucronatum TaxID=133383 RepID=A0A1R0H3D7_9FUNG|nr:Homeobox protein YOX1 [Smittium mucronatum]
MSNVPIWQRRSDKRSVPFNPHLNLSKTGYYPTHSINSGNIDQYTEVDNIPSRSSYKNLITKQIPNGYRPLHSAGNLPLSYNHQIDHRTLRSPSFEQYSIDHYDPHTRLNSPVGYPEYTPRSSSSSYFFGHEASSNARTGVNRLHKDFDASAHSYRQPYYRPHSSRIHHPHYYYPQSHFSPYPSPFYKNFNHSNSKPSYSFFYMQQRRRHTKQEIETLERAFKINPMPSKEEKIELSFKTNMEVKHISIWFQNKRQAVKKKKLEKDQSPSHPDLIDEYNIRSSEKLTPSPRHSNSIDIKNLINHDYPFDRKNTEIIPHRDSYRYFGEPLSANLQSKFVSLENNPSSLEYEDSFKTPRSNHSRSASIPNTYHNEFSHTKALNLDSCTDIGNADSPNTRSKANYGYDHKELSLNRKPFHTVSPPYNHSKHDRRLSPNHRNSRDYSLDVPSRDFYSPLKTATNEDFCVSTQPRLRSLSPLSRGDFHLNDPSNSRPSFDSPTSPSKSISLSDEYSSPPKKPHSSIPTQPRKFLKLLINE